MKQINRAEIRKVVEEKEGHQKTLAVGTETELITWWNDNKKDLLSWVLENGDENDNDVFEKTMSVEVKTIKDLEAVFDVCDYSWWTLKIE